MDDRKIGVMVRLAPDTMGDVSDGIRETLFGDVNLTSRILRECSSHKYLASVEEHIAVKGLPVWILIDPSRGRRVAGRRATHRFIK